MTRPQEIGERVQKLRRAFCMTGSQLAHRAGFHANTLLRIERGEGYPSMENLCKVEMHSGAVRIIFWGAQKRPGDQMKGGVRHQTDPR